ncbi:M42 family metallopeptidase [Carnobacterium gallinarum]|uniref:M42 family metallopeptidase n=1 Tax=Carnobacterium gallinarum TaxID=2749 RepID=UPI0005563047|nr:M42 family metallopeptidase [Carnobacterium gallinarum]
MKRKTREFYQALSMADGVAGREQEVRDVLANFFNKNDALKQEVDGFGNFYVTTDLPQTKKVMLMAHTDEVGFLVKHITEEGFIYFQPLGGWWGHVLLGQLVTVTARKNKLKYRGVIGTTPSKNHAPEKVIAPTDMYIDLGVSSRKAVSDLGILPGDMITPYTESIAMADENYLLGKAWDDRVGCGIMAEVLNEMSRLSLTEFNVVGVGSVQEEVGTRGSKIAAKKVLPDVAIVLDVATAKDTPQADRYRNRELGKGPGIVLYDKTALADLHLVDKMVEVAEIHQIPYQYDQLSGGGTDAGSVQLTGGSIPTIVISLGVRYCHSGASIIQLEDVKNCVALLVKFIQTIDQEGGLAID